LKAWITNGTNAWRVFLPDTNGEVHWFRIRIIDASTAMLYMDGELVDTTIQYVTSSNPNIQFYLQSAGDSGVMRIYRVYFAGRSEEHTSELQSRENLVCRLLLEKKKK